MIFTEDEVRSCYEFSQNMIGNHRQDKVMRREEWEIFRDDFRGKLGEVILAKYIQMNFPDAIMDEGVDYSIKPVGEWDTSDLIVNGKYISVKSVKQRSNFLMIEKSRYNEQGEYCYKNNDEEDVKIDFYVLVRVSVDPDMSKDAMSYNCIKDLVEKHKISADILGGISHSEFWRKKHEAKKGIKCIFKNLKALCDGDNTVLERPTGREDKTQILQQDNYILYKNELIRVEEILEEVVAQ